MSLLPNNNNRAARRAAAKHIERESRKFGERFEVVPFSDAIAPPNMVRAWRNRKFMVQQYLPRVGDEDMVVCRLTVNIIALDGDRWQDGIGWNELQDIKAQVGFADFDAVEVFPRNGDIIDVAALRHLWVLRGLLPFAWRKTALASQPQAQQ